MNARAPAAFVLAASAAALAPAAVHGQPASAKTPAIGAQVTDDKGKPVGRIEKIILGADGRPRQALVRVERVLRALPLEALQPSGGGYQTVLSRAEILALPPAD